MNSFSKSRAVGVVLLVTLIEDAGLIAWLALFRSSLVYMGISVAALVLLVTLIIEHSIMQRTENPTFTGRVFLELFGFTVLEVVNWSVWLFLLQNNSGLLSMSTALASAYFFVGFYVEHQITENVITGQPFLHFRNARGAITAGVILETLSEGIGARLWILYAFSSMGPIAVVYLVIGSTIEHAIQYVVGRIPVERQVTRR